jgi:hypothetical protein
VTLKPGTYLTGSLFLKSEPLCNSMKGSALVGPQKLDDYDAARKTFLADSSNLLWLNVGHAFLSRLWKMLLVPGN